MPETLTHAPEAPTTTEAPEQTKPLKLSEAIRLGAMMTEQTFGEFGDDDRTCAIGAAQKALGLPVSAKGPLNGLLHSRQADAPCGHGSATWTVGSLIMHLNDDDKWPREKIADWLEGMGL